MRFEFHPEALAEYQAASHYYARQQSDLDLRFVASVEDAIRSILKNPLRWRRFNREVRRCLTRTLPHGVLYTVEADFVPIVAPTHCSREPGYWKHRLD